MQVSASHQLALQVEHLSQEAQDIIRQYTSQAGPVAGRQAALCAATGVLPWRHASVEHFERLASVSPPSLRARRKDALCEVTVFLKVLLALAMHPGSWAACGILKVLSGLMPAQHF